MVLAWCRISETGAHHACLLLLQALFISAMALPVITSTTAARTINKGLFILNLASACPPTVTQTNDRTPQLRKCLLDLPNALKRPGPEPNRCLGAILVSVLTVWLKCHLSQA